MAREMRDSGVEWLDVIPGDWDIEQAGQALYQVKNKNDGMVETNLLSLSYGKVKRRDIDARGGLLPDSFDGYNIVEAGDIVLRFTDLQNDQRSLRTGRVTERGIITSAYTTVRPVNPETSRFLHYALHAYDLRKGFYGMGSGVRQGLKWQEAKYILLPKPSIDEQRHIADYLDAKCAEIDRAVEAAERSIEELTTYRRAVVRDVLHWEDWPMTHVGVVTTKVGSGKTPRGGREVYVSEGVPIIRSQNVRDEGIRLDDVAFITEETDATMASTHVLSGDLLLNITGASIGRSCVVPDNLGTANVNQHVCIVRPVKSVVCAEWLHQCWYSELGQHYVMTTQVGATREALNSSQIKAFRIPLPPLNEQKRLSEECDVTGARVDTLIAAKRSIIEDLKAYKQSLVYEVVTGKREV